MVLENGFRKGFTFTRDFQVFTVLAVPDKEGGYYVLEEYNERTDQYILHSLDYSDIVYLIYS